MHNIKFRIVCCLLIVMNLLSPLMAESGKFISIAWSKLELPGKVYEKSTLLIPVKIEGINKQFYAQLDTGCESTFLYGTVLKQFIPDLDTTTLNLMLAWYDPDKDVGVYSAPVAWSMFENVVADTSSNDPSERIIGTVGSGILSGKILILDFTKNQFAVLADTLDMPEEIRRNASYVPAQINGSLFYINAALGSDTLQSVLMDTGSSLITLLIPKGLWQNVTGLKGNEPAVIVDTVPAWGKGLELWRAPSKANLIFGNVEVKNPVVDCAQWPDSHGDSFFLIGNAPFFDNYTIIYDYQNSRFGIMENH